MCIVPCRANAAPPLERLSSNVRHPMVIPRRNFARIKTFTYVYADTCCRGYDEFLKCSAQIAEIGDVEYDPELDEASRRRDIAGLQAIVFSAMCFESAIYDYAADHLGDSYVQEHFDKLDILSKWVVVPRLVVGYEIQKDRAPYGALKSLIAARNRLVHSKSEPIKFDRIEGQLERMRAEAEKLTAAIHNAYRALLLMSMEFDAAIGLEGNPLPCYDPRFSLLLEIPPRLRPAFDQCREIMGFSKDA